MVEDIEENEEGKEGEVVVVGYRRGGVKSM